MVLILMGHSRFTRLSYLFNSLSSALRPEKRLQPRPPHYAANVRTPFARMLPRVMGKGVCATDFCSVLFRTSPNGHSGQQRELLAGTCHNAPGEQARHDQI